MHSQLNLYSVWLFFCRVNKWTLSSFIRLRFFSRRLSCMCQRNPRYCLRLLASKVKIFWHCYCVNEFNLKQRCCKKKRLCILCHLHKKRKTKCQSSWKNFVQAGLASYFFFFLYVGQMSNYEQKSSWNSFRLGTNSYLM